MRSVLISSESRYPVNRKRITAEIENFLAKTGLDEVEISLAIVGSRKMRQLSRNFWGVDEISEVLTFAQEAPRGPDGILRLGDIVICYPLARQEAAEEGKMLDQKIWELIEHGLKHLLGEDHE